MNTIASFFVSGSANSTPDRNTLTQAEAWRRAFEKENFVSQAKSIKTLVREQPAPAAHEAHWQSASKLENHSNLVPGNSVSVTPSSLRSKFSQGSLSQGLLGTSQFSNFGTTGLNLNPSNDFKLLSSTPVKDLAAQNKAVVSIGFFETYFKQKWSLNNVHVLDTDDGVKVWIRDSSLVVESVKIKDLIDQIRQSLLDDGKNLAQLVINGHTVC